MATFGPMLGLQSQNRPKLPWSFVALISPACSCFNRTYTSWRLKVTSYTCFPLTSCLCIRDDVLNTSKPMQ